MDHSRGWSFSICDLNRDVLFLFGAAKNSKGTPKRPSVGRDNTVSGLRFCHQVI